MAEQQKSAQDREQAQRFDRNYQQLKGGLDAYVKARPDAADTQVNFDAPRVNWRDRTATATISVRSPQKSKNFHVKMQGGDVWIKDSARNPHPSNAPLTSQGYNFDGAAAALTYVTGALSAESDS